MSDYYHSNLTYQGEDYGINYNKNKKMFTSLLTWSPMKNCLPLLCNSNVLSMKGRILRQVSWYLMRCSDCQDKFDYISIHIVISNATYLLILFQTFPHTHCKHVKTYKNANANIIYVSTDIHISVSGHTKLSFNALGGAFNMFQDFFSKGI